MGEYSQVGLININQKCESKNYLFRANVIQWQETGEMLVENLEFDG